MSFITILKYFFLWQVIIVGITLAAPTFLRLQEQNLGGTQGYLENPILKSRANFDGVHYLWIADNDYGFGQHAFFPLYPRLIDFLRPLFNTALASGVIVSSVSFAIGLYFFSRLIRLDYSPPIVKLSVTTLLLFPVSFFFSFVYTEGFFFMLTLLAFYCARTNRWWFAGLFGALASNTRLVGIVLFPALVLEWWRSGKKPKDLVPLLFIPLGLIAFMIYLEKTTGDPYAFLHAQTLFGQGRSESIVLLHQVFWRSLKQVFTVDSASPVYLTVLLEFFTAIVFTLTSIISVFRLRPSYSLFGIATFILPTLTGTFTSLPRYVLVCFPAFILLGLAFSKLDARLRTLFSIFGVVVMFIYLSLFVRGYWVS